MTSDVNYREFRLPDFLVTEPENIFFLKNTSKIHHNSVVSVSVQKSHPVFTGSLSLYVYGLKCFGLYLIGGLRNRVIM